MYYCSSSSEANSSFACSCLYFWAIVTVQDARPPRGCFWGWTILNRLIITSANGRKTQTNTNTYSHAYSVSIHFLDCGGHSLICPDLVIASTLFRSPTVSPLPFAIYTHNLSHVWMQKPSVVSWGIPQRAVHSQNEVTSLCYEDTHPKASGWKIQQNMSTSDTPRQSHTATKLWSLLNVGL